MGLHRKKKVPVLAVENNPAMLQGLLDVRVFKGCGGATGRAFPLGGQGRIEQSPGCGGAGVRSQVRIVRGGAGGEEPQGRVREVVPGVVVAPEVPRVVFHRPAADPEA